jgi:hypothetical protein
VRISSSEGPVVRSASRRSNFWTGAQASNGRAQLSALAINAAGGMLTWVSMLECGPAEPPANARVSCRAMESSQCRGTASDFAHRGRFYRARSRGTLRHCGALGMTPTMRPPGSVDAYSESERITAWFTMIKENLGVPFETTVLEVLVAVCNRGCIRQRAPAPI